MTNQIFEIPSSGSHPLLAVVMLAPLLLSAVLAALFWPRALHVDVSTDAMAIRGSIYGRSVPRSHLRLDEARTVNLAATPELTPRVRTNGVGLPNYRVGWFRLRDGERALCFLTSTDAVLYLPTTENYALLISTSSPHELLASLKAPS